MAENTQPMSPFGFDGFNRDVINFPHGSFVPQAILQDGLAVKNGFETILYTRQDGLLRDLIQEFVTASHRAEQRVQFQVLRQRRFVGRQFFLQVKITVAIQQVRFHGFNLSFSRS